MAFSIDSKVGELLDNNNTSQVLEKHVPGISKHPQIGMARGFALVTAAKYSGGLISPEVLKEIDSDLRALVN
ncbi:hypothetical protein EON09_14515 [Pseudomonas soli]|uniref:Uncharacterized protein n=1 Tax=Pseudomonas soli TaxID=1306993 RepID=A0A1H9JU49_9PSED|nr:MULTISPECIES: hypothetical protein [Pseudomonas]AUY32328.1 hypothetical protein C3F42_03445 [Pseudomonas sp. PONIH3]MBH3606458.1 hypothetical protein [Pseudomonas aeruginosa]MBI8921741.1 hypothetical protein [Pseudomonas aeruginosa]MDT3712414.1 hypothetical protein [Pseudomonas soli]MDT3729751.1 hypothetical protein [Pseudomonas soli]